MHRSGKYFASYTQDALLSVYAIGEEKPVFVTSVADQKPPQRIDIFSLQKQQLVVYAQTEDQIHFWELSLADKSRPLTQTNYQAIPIKNLSPLQPHSAITNSKTLLVSLSCPPGGGIYKPGLPLPLNPHFILKGRGHPRFPA